MNETEEKRLRDMTKMYEGILQKVPDEYSLQALIDVYIKLDDQDRLHYCRGILEQIRQGEKVQFQIATEAIVEKAKPRVVERVTKAPVQRVQRQERPMVAEPVPLQWSQGDKKHKRSSLEKYSHEYSIKSHVDLLIKLHSVDLLSIEQFSYVMRKLSAHKFDPQCNKVFSVLAFVEDFHHVSMEMVHYFLMKKSLLPYVDLSLYEKDPQLEELLPKSFVFNEGLVIFKKIAQTYCVALLNPLDVSVMEKVSGVLDAPVCFFFTSAQEFDMFICK